MSRKLPDGEGKRYPLSLRTTRDLQDRLKQAAMQSGRSLAAEVELRLENSFVEADRQDQELKASLISKAMLGDAVNNDLIRAITAAIGAAMAYTGKHWKDDVYTRAAVRSAIEAVYRRQFSSRPLPGDGSDLDRGRLARAFEAGLLYGKLMVAPEADRDVVQYLREIVKADTPRAEEEAEASSFSSMTPARQNAALKELYGIDMDTLNLFSVPSR